MKVVKLHLDVVYSIAVTNDCEYIVSGSQDKSIRIFDTGSKALVHVFERVDSSKSYQ